MTETVKSQYDMRDPRTQYPQPPFPKQPQDKPGFDHKMEPKADHGENSYQGFGRLKDRKALITGGDSGIGRAIAIAYAREGAEICINYLPEEKEDADWVCDLLEGEGHAVHRMPGNLTDKEFCNTLIKEAHERMGGLDILVNNAGASMAKSFEEVTDDEWEFDFDLKVWGAVRFIRSVVPEMRKVGGGRIINVTNLGGRTPGAASMPTSISRAAGQAITKGLSRDLAKDNILVTTVCIGLIKSGQAERRLDRMQTANANATIEEVWAESVRGRGVPLGRMGEAEEAGDVITFLASDRASYLTGIAVNIDGGNSAVL